MRSTSGMTPPATASPWGYGLASEPYHTPAMPPWVTASTYRVPALTRMPRDETSIGGEMGHGGTASTFSPSTVAGSPLASVDQICTWRGSVEKLGTATATVVRSPVKPAVKTCPRAPPPMPAATFLNESDC